MSSRPTGGVTSSLSSACGQGRMNPGAVWAGVEAGAPEGATRDQPDDQGDRRVLESRVVERRGADGH